MIDRLKNYFDSLPISPENRRILNLPNAITLFRLFIIPVLFLLLTSPDRITSLLIALAFVMVYLTDFLDGYVARYYNIVTPMGKLFDPIADKLVINTAMILMIPIERIPAWIVALIIIRDFAVDGIRSFAASEGVTIQASPLGKKKTLCQVVAVTALIIHYPVFGINAHVVGTVILYLALILSIYSGVDYMVKFWNSTLKVKR
ncbi:MAG: CDP-diacylglycerol--glycerol-3-phosphate 3-phosphatidyltransferase [Syntrophales bacterium]|nr:CDP-diacylglycerol--glycerol-3-phosphate 3-phosphatidyltransferase [Syntrophales bacterium]